MFKINIKKKAIISFMPSLFVGMLGALLIQGLFHFQQRMTVSTVNITGLVSSFIKETARQNLLLEEKEKKVTHFSLVMQRVLADMAVHRHTVILPSAY